MATFANNLTVGSESFVIENGGNNANTVGNMLANAPGGVYQDGGQNSYVLQLITPKTMVMTSTRE